MERFTKKLAEYSGSTALVVANCAYSYGELIAATQRMKQAFEDQKIARGDVVVVSADYSLEAVAAILVGYENRNIVVPLRCAKGVDHGATAALVGANWVMDVSNGSVACRNMHQSSRGHELVEELRRLDSAGLVLISSGSTGTPKAILLNLDKIFAKYLRLDSRPQTIAAFLLFDHIGGFNTLFHTLFSGGTVVPCPERTPDAVCSLIERHRVSVLPTTPTFLNLLLMSEAYKRFDTSSLKLITYGTEVMTEQTLLKLRKAFPAARLKQTYGLSETGILSTRTEDSGSLFIELGTNVQHKVIDGILWLKCDTAMLGYLNAEAPFKDGWLCTGDMVEVQDGKYRILGRKETIINVGGLKVYPAEIENVVQTVPGVIESVALPKKNPVTGHVVAVRIRIDPAVSDVEKLKKEIKLACAQRLDAFKVPRHISFQSEPLHNDRFKKSAKHVRDEQVAL